MSESFSSFSPSRLKDEQQQSQPYPSHHQQHFQQQQQNSGQLNKGVTEKRDLENINIEELAELISASIADMNAFSGKPDKSVTLQETVSQLQQISKAGQTENRSSEAVQQSQVSSSKPSIVASKVLGSLLLEALEGFLFVVNSQGKVEFVSENVCQYLKYSQDDLVGKSIYNIIHVGDHAQFSNSLVPMSLSTSIAWPNDSPNKGRNFNCRMLIKPPSEEDDDVEVKQTYISQYESMHITAILQPYLGQKFSEVHSDSDNQTCLVCIARRMPLTEKVNMMIGIDQFTTKQDLSGKILAADVNSLPKGQYGDILLSGNIQDFCHSNDISQLRKHLTEVVKTASNTSGVYRFKLQENRYVFVQTKSKLFFSHLQKPEYILSTHSIIRECDSDVELKGSASTSLMKSIIGQSGVGQPRNQYPNSIGVTGVNSGPCASFNRNMNMMSPVSHHPTSMGIGMSGLNSLNNTGIGSLSSGPSAESDLDFDFLNPEWDLVGLGSTTGVSDSLNLGGYTNNLSGGGSSVGVGISVNSGNNQHLFTSTSSNTWSTAPPLKTSSSGVTSVSSTPSSLQSALLGNHSLLNMTASMSNHNVGNASHSMVNIMGGHNGSNVSGKQHPSVHPAQLQQSSSNFDGQKSPQFSPNPGTVGPRNVATFSAPGHRVNMGCARSPGSNNSGNMGAISKFGMNYQRKTVSPLMSPQSGLPHSPVWGRSPNPVGQEYSGLGGPSSVGSMVSQPSPLQALQSMDTQTSSSIDMLSHSPRNTHDGTFSVPATPYVDSSPGAMQGSNMDGRSSGQRSGKLCQLLTQNTNLDQLGLRPSQMSVQVPRPSSNKSALPSPLMSKSGMKSPDDCFHQSPTPGPGQSPPEKPQSTSNEDGDGASSGLAGLDLDKKDNFILKKLLSQDEDPDPPTIMDQEISSSPQSIGGVTNDRDKNNMDKNEAEPKKTNNVLLKQLLSEENMREDAAQKRTNRGILNTLETNSVWSTSTPDLHHNQGELLHQLLQNETESDGRAITSAPAESTSQEQEVSGSRSRHQSGQQEPQSTTSHPLTPSPSHQMHGSLPSTVSSVLTGNQHSSPHLSQEFFMDTSNSAAPMSSSSSFSFKQNEAHRMQNKKLDVYLNSLWEHGPDSPTAKEITLQLKQTKKRKASSSDVDSTEMDTEPSTSGGLGNTIGTGNGPSSKLSQKNALLAQLLSKKAAKETVVNTQLTINPLGLPQQRIPKNITDKIFTVKSGRSSSTDEVSSGSDGVGGGTLNMTGNTKAAIPLDSSRTNPNTPFPGNSNNSGGPGMGKDGSGLGGFNQFSGVSSIDISEESVTSQFEQFQQLLSQGLIPMGTESLLNDTSDPLLQQILQQAADLEEDITTRNLSSSGVVHSPGVGNNPAPTPQAMSAPSTPRPSPQLLQSLPQPLPPHPPHNMQQQQQQPPPPPQIYHVSESSSEMSQEDQNMLAQLEQLLNEGSLHGMESFLGNMDGGPQTHLEANSVHGSINEQMAIDAIQRQLMNEDPLASVVGSTNIHTVNSGSLQNVGSAGMLQQNQTTISSSPMSEMQRGILTTGGDAVSHGHPQMMVPMGMAPRQFPGQIPQQAVNQAASVSPGQQPPPGIFSPQSQQFPQPRGPLANALQGNPQAGFQSHTSIQVRQTLLQQHRNRTLEKRQRLQAQERQRLVQLQQQQQRLIQQQQQQQQSSPQQFGQRFPQPNMAGMDTGTSPGQLPENFRDLMNTGHAPNVTLPVQRGGVVSGPMSPRLPLPHGTVRLGQQQQLSPHYPGAPQGMGAPVVQWGAHPQAPANGGAGDAISGLHPVQAGQYPGMQRHRSLSGNSLPSPGGQNPRFQFPPDAPFSAPPVGQSQMTPLFSPPGQSQGVPQSSLVSVSQQQQQQQQQQQMFSPNRMLQRSMSMTTGRGSPRTSQSPFGSSPDPLLLSPHAMSPNSALRQQQPSQVSPPFNQSHMTSGYNPAAGGQFSNQVSVSSSSSLPVNYNSSHLPLGGPSTTNTPQSFHEFDMPYFDSTLSDSKKSTTDMGIGGSGATSTSQYVKQELRNICSARSEKQMQSQLQQQLMQQQHQQQQQHQLPPAQSMQHPLSDFDMAGSVLPLDILETIDDMTQDHRTSLPDDLKEDDVVSQTRQEAKKRCKQLRAMASSTSPLSSEADEESESRAASLFRNQLLKGPPQPSISNITISSSKSTTSSIPQVNVVQKEPRTPVDVKPVDSKNSLLQKLLAD